MCNLGSGEWKGFVPHCIVLGRLAYIGGLPVDVTYSLEHHSFAGSSFAIFSLSQKMPPKQKAYDGIDPRAAKAAGVM
jgi:hypothetical protein